MINLGCYCLKKKVFIPCPILFASFPAPEIVSPHPANAINKVSNKNKNMDALISFSYVMAKWFIAFVAFIAFMALTQ
jgi:hypothetical protein